MATQWLGGRRERPAKMVRRLHERLVDVHAGRQQQLMGVIGVGAVVGGFALLLVWTEAGGFACPLSFFALIGLSFYWFGWQDHHHRLVDKLQLAEGIVDELRDDFARSRKLRVEVDERHYNDTAKIVWEGKSQHGNRKVRYHDRWFSMVGWLLDGTRIKVRRRRDVKTRKGSVVKEKWRATVILRVPDHADPVDATAVEAEVLHTVGTRLKRPPEGLSVSVGPSDRRVKVQLKVEGHPITEAQLVALAEAAYAGARGGV